MLRCQYNFPIYVCTAICFSLVKFLVSLVSVGSFRAYISHLIIPHFKLDCLFCARDLFFFIISRWENTISVVFISRWEHSISVAFYFSVGKFMFYGFLFFCGQSQVLWRFILWLAFFFSECGVPLGSAFYILLSSHLIIC